MTRIITMILAAFIACISRTSCALTLHTYQNNNSSLKLRDVTNFYKQQDKEFSVLSATKYFLLSHDSVLIGDERVSCKFIIYCPKKFISSKAFINLANIVNDGKSTVLHNLLYLVTLLQSRQYLLNNLEVVYAAKILPTSLRQNINYSVEAIQSNLSIRFSQIVFQYVFDYCSAFSELSPYRGLYMSLVLESIWYSNLEINGFYAVGDLLNRLNITKERNLSKIYHVWQQDAVKLCTTDSRFISRQLSSIWFNTKLWTIDSDRGDQSVDAGKMDKLLALSKDRICFYINTQYMAQFTVKDDRF